MRVALFARVSSDEQAEADRVSLPAQLRVMRERCEREKWDVVRTFEAAGESAFTDDLAKRPTLLAAVAAAEQGEFDLLMVHESSRFARSALLALQVRSRLEKAGVVLLDAGAAMGSRTAESALMFTVTAGMNEWYSAKLSEHLRKAKEQQFAEGLHLGHPPFGYRRDGRRRPFAIVPEEAAAVRDAFRDYAAGATYTAIARQWNARGLVPRSNDGHTRFTVPAMQSIFENRFYAGWVSHKEQWRRGAHEAQTSYGVALAATTAAVWATTAAGVWYASRPATADLSARVVSCRFRQSPTANAATLELDNHDGALNGAPNATFPGLFAGASLQVSPGYASGTGGAAEYGVQHELVITRLAYGVRDGRSVVTLECGGPWEELANWRAPQAWQTAAGATTRSAIFARLCARVGVPLTGTGSSDCRRCGRCACGESA